MRCLVKALAVICLLWAIRPAGAVPANLKENYQPIVDRNPFGLRPPPPPPTNNTAPPQIEKPAVDIFLTGITSVGYPRWPKKVFLKTEEKNKKEPKFYELGEGQEEDGIKILSIDDVNRKVRVHTDSGETMLSFETHGIAAPPAAGAPGAVPGQPGQPGGVPQPLPGGIPTPPGNPPAFNQFRPAQPTAAGGAGSNPSTYRSIPSRSIRSRSATPSTSFDGGTSAPGFTGGSATPDAQQPQIDPAEQYLRMHLDKVNKERQGIPMPPLPFVQ